VISEAEVRRAQEEPPADTRAWTRAHLLRLAGAARVEEVDWDVVEVRGNAAEDTPAWPRSTTVHLSCPFRATRAENEGLFTDNRSLDEIVTTLSSTASSLQRLLPSRTPFLEEPHETSSRQHRESRPTWQSG
jgi:hypothetical protein